MMSNRRKPQRPAPALFPAKAELPEADKMHRHSSENLAIYEFFDHLLQRGFVLARRDPETGQLRAMKPSTVEHEVLLFRGVDVLAYRLEMQRLRREYEWLARKYGVDEASVDREIRAEYADEEPGTAQQATMPVGEADALANLWSRLSGGVGG